MATNHEVAKERSAHRPASSLPKYRVARRRRSRSPTAARTPCISLGSIAIASGESSRSILSACIPSANGSTCVYPRSPCSHSQVSTPQPKTSRCATSGACHHSSGSSCVVTRIALSRRRLTTSATKADELACIAGTRGMICGDMIAGLEVMRSFCTAAKGPPLLHRRRLGEVSREGESGAPGAARVGVSRVLGPTALRTKSTGRPAQR